MTASHAVPDDRALPPCKVLKPCACSCAHRWDGPWVHTADGGSITCSICGITAENHDMANGI